jgi:hypothetical protein
MKSGSISKRLSLLNTIARFPPSTISSERKILNISKIAAGPAGLFPVRDDGCPREQAPLVGGRKVK